MNSKSNYFKSLLLLSGIALFVSCDKDSNDLGPDGSENVTPPTSEIYPSGAIVWKKDTTVLLKDHFVVKADQSLYVEEGATIIASNNDIKPEIIILGNLYCMGTAEKPVVFTVEESAKTDRFSREWGGIICGYDAKEVYMDYTTIEYAGAITTDGSASIQYGLFKTETGEGVPAFHFCNKAGSFVITNSTFRNNAEDHIYITGGKSIVANSRFITNGFDGGEAINYKSDCLADIAYNLIYDANTNGFKLSNTGMTDVQAHLYCYNNTILNTGWRRPKVKGGSIWLEQGVVAKLYNNLIADCRWGLKQSTETPMAATSVITPNYYFATTEKGIEQMQASEENGILNGANDIMSATAGDKKPLFKNFTQQANININASGNTDEAPVAFEESWSFALASNSPALTGGDTNFKSHFADSPIVMTGLEGIMDNQFKSPRPSAFFGAYGN